MDDATATDDAENVVTDDAWKNDGYVPEEDDTPENIVDDAWTADGWEQSNLSGASLASGNRSTPIWPFVLGAMVAGVMGAAFVVARVSSWISRDVFFLEILLTLLIIWRRLCIVSMQ